MKTDKALKKEKTPCIGKSKIGREPRTAKEKNRKIARLRSEYKRGWGGITKGIDNQPGRCNREQG